MKLALIPVLALSAGLLAACDRPASTSSTTVVKEPTTVEKKETVIRDQAAPSSSTTIVQPSAPAPSSSTSVNIDATKPSSSSEISKSQSTSRVDTPMGTATKTETTKTETSK